VAASTPVKTVVLRQGPPPRGRSIASALAGVLGAILIVLSVFLATALPVPDVVLPQFQISYQNLVGPDLPEQSFAFTLAGGNDGRIHNFIYNVTDDNVYEIRVAVHFTDDVPASQPDVFTLTLFGPNGDLKGGPVQAKNQLGVRDNATYVPVPFVQTFSFDLQGHPPDAIVQGSADDTKDTVAARAETKAHVNTQGAWRVEVNLIQAGGCVPPTNHVPPATDDGPRYAACQAEARPSNPQGGSGVEDPGNSFTVGSFSYSRFTVSAEPLS
jgi:hypothetical protein